MLRGVIFAQPLSIPASIIDQACNRLYIDHKYADLTIVCGEQTWLVHKAIVCPRSLFFEKACSSGFKVQFLLKDIFAQDFS
jgi:hypothetical protein